MVENFLICINQGYWPVIFFFGGIFVWFWYLHGDDFRECLGSAPFSSVFWKFEKDQYKFFERWSEFPIEAIWFWTSVVAVGRFLILVKSPYFSLICSDFLFLRNSVLVVCSFLGKYPFLLGCLICWSTIVHSISWSFVSVRY